MIKVHTPIKLKSYFLSKISKVKTAIDAGPVRMRIPYVRLLNLIKLEKGGSAIRIFISDEDCVNAIARIDSEARAAVKKHNAKWFHNDMDSETIDALFRNSVNNLSNHMTVLLSDSHDPTIYRDGQIVDVLTEDLIHDTNKKDMHVSIDIEAQGLCFYPKKFGIRWFIKSIHISTDQALHEKHANETWVDKKEIEDVWKEDLKETCTCIDTDVATLEEKIRKLRELKAELNEEYATACSMPANADWDARLKVLATKSSRYHSGEFM
jgi:hypothetical protein